MKNDSPIIHFSREWKSLGLEIMILKVELEHGSKKLYKIAKKITESEIANPDLISNEFNFLAIFLKNSGLMCLDIESIENSVDKFYSLLKKRQIDSSSFVMERSLNGGLHIYFRTPNFGIKTQHFKSIDGIKYDVLVDGRVFTAPSSFNRKKYEWIGSCFESKTKIEDFPIFPVDLYDFL